MSKLPISAIVMTYNEARNLRECLASIADRVDEIIVVDSGSIDATQQIALSFNAKFFKNPWINHAAQFDWALKNTHAQNDWILRLDADERWTPEGLDTLAQLIDTDSVDGIYVKIKIFFMGKWMRYGGFYPNHFLRVFKKQHGAIEQRWMDEHIFVQGRTVVADIDVIESNYDRQHDISLWIDKHNRYATQEAIDILRLSLRLGPYTTIAKFWGNKIERKRWLKEHVYAKLPLFLRPFAYYFYRYVLLAGFLDGRRGLIFHTLQGFWYRFLVDAKVFQIQQTSRVRDKSIPSVVRDLYGIEISNNPDASHQP